MQNEVHLKNKPFPNKVFYTSASLVDKNCINIKQKH